MAGRPTKSLINDPGAATLVCRHPIGWLASFHWADVESGPSPLCRRGRRRKSAAIRFGHTHTHTLSHTHTHTPAHTCSFTEFLPGFSEPVGTFFFVFWPVLSDFTGFYRVSMTDTRIYWILPDPSGFYWDLTSFTGFLRAGGIFFSDSGKSYRVLLGFTEFQ